MHSFLNSHFPVANLGVRFPEEFSNFAENCLLSICIHLVVGSSKSILLLSTLGHIEVDTLYQGGAGGVTVNSMNAPNNSTMQCGCENIDCPFCNQMMSIQMSSK